MEFLQDMLTIGLYCCYGYAGIIIAVGFWDVATRNAMPPVQPVITQPQPVITQPQDVMPPVQPTKSIRTLRQEVRDRNLQSAVKAQLGKSVAQCTKDELMLAIANCA
jgi:hypothetical protein